MINVEKNVKMGNAQGMRAPVSTWKSNPGDFNAAVEAAAYYANYNDDNMVVFPGNSYGNRVFHIANPKTESLGSYVPTVKQAPGAFVTTEGEVFRAILSS